MEDQSRMLNNFGEKLSRLDNQNKRRFYAIFQGLTFFFCKKYKVKINVSDERSANLLFATAFEAGEMRLLGDIMKTLEEFEKSLDMTKLLERVLVVTNKLENVHVGSDAHKKCSALLNIMYGYYKNSVGNSVGNFEKLHIVFPIIMGSLMQKKDNMIIMFLEKIEELLK